MSNITVVELEVLISSSSGIVNFGCSEDAVDNIWLDKAEETLGLKLCKSYRWFLKTYSGGEICGEEVFSIYGMDFEDVNGGDIVYQHIVNKRNGLTTEEKLVVSENDFGEIYYFDYSEFDGNECPIKLRLPSGNTENYASDFYEYLKKRIKSYL